MQQHILWMLSLYLQKLYVTMFPCNECAKLLIQAGIKEVIFHEVCCALPSWQYIYFHT